MRISRAAIEAGLGHLRAVDPVLRDLIDQVGEFQLRLERDRFRALARSIISQQISARAASSIYQRLINLLAPRQLSAESLSGFTPDQLRAAGVSPQKAGYLLDLARKVHSNQVRLAVLSRLSDEEVVNELVQVKGIGVWTAQMFLIFSLGRLDVFPHEDLGIRVALRNRYGLKDLPDRKRSHKIAESWRPYATIGSWYCWRSLDLAKR